MAFCIAALTSGSSSAESGVVASYRDGEVTKRDVEAELLLGTGSGTAPDLSSAVEAIVLRRSLLGDLDELPESARTLCSELGTVAAAGVAAESLKRAVADESMPNEAAKRAYFEANRESFRRPKRWRLRNVFVRVPPGTPAADRAAARERLAQALNEVTTEDEFVDLARSMSDSPTASRGGRIGFVSASQLLPEVAAALEALEPGQVSTIIGTEDGFTALYCSEIEPAGDPSFTDAEPSITGRLQRDAFSASWSELDRSIRERTAPRVFLKAVSSGSDTDTVLAIRGSDGSIRLSRVTYLHRIAADSLSDPSLWSDAEHTAALLDIALLLGRADEAGRRNLLSDDEILNRAGWQAAQATAECVLEFEARSMVEPPTDAEIAAWYREHEGTFVEPATHDIELLRVDIGPPSPQAQFRELQQLAAGIKDGTTDLPGIAERLRSEGQEVQVERLEDLTAFAVESLGRNLAAVVAATAVGEVGGPTQEGNQLILVRVLGREPARQLTLQEATPKIRRRLEDLGLRKAKQTISADMLAELEITYH